MTYAYKMAVFTCLALALPARADQWVAPYGVDATDEKGFAIPSSAEQPWRTFQFAVDHGSQNEVVHVYGGVYTEPDDVSVDFKGKRITLQAMPGQTPTVDGGSTARVFLFNSGETSDATLDGFTFRNGHAPGGANATQPGTAGVILINNASPTILNCTFQSSTAGQRGGAIAIFGGHPAVRNCTFQSNAAVDQGGAIYIQNGSLTIQDCTFTGNHAVNGGGISLSDADLTLTHCSFSSNVAAAGGGLYADALGPATLAISRSAFLGNTADGTLGTPVGLGGGVYVSASGAVTTSIRDTVAANNTAKGGAGIWLNVPSVDLSFITCTGNTSSGSGTPGGIRYSATNPTPLNNCLLWGDSSPETGTSTLFNHCDVQGKASAATSTISADPLFVNAAGSDFHLQSTSPCIGVGDNAAVISGETDVDGNARLIGGHADLGAYESGYPDVLPFQPYTIYDAQRALYIAAGFITATTADITRLDIVTSAGNVINLRDATKLARKSSGLDPNP